MGLGFRVTANRRLGLRLTYYVSRRVRRVGGAVFCYQISIINLTAYTNQRARFDSKYVS